MPTEDLRGDCYYFQYRIGFRVQLVIVRARSVETAYVSIAYVIILVQYLRYFT